MTNMRSRRRNYNPKPFSLFVAAAALIGTIFFVSNPDALDQVFHWILGNKNTKNHRFSAAASTVAEPKPLANKKAAKPTPSKPPVAELTQPGAAAVAVREETPTPTVKADP